MKWIPRIGWPRAMIGVIAVTTLPLAIVIRSDAAIITAVAIAIVAVVNAVVQKDDPPPNDGGA